MTMFRMPIFTWNMLVTGDPDPAGLPGPDRRPDHALLRPTLRHAYLLGRGGGVPVLWQHIFWFWGHPEVYILALPFFGMATEIIAVFSRKPVFGYKGMVFATLSIGALSLGVWAHHMFTTGVVLLPFFSIMSLLIAVPTGIKIFNWIGTMWRGEIWFSDRHVDGHRLPLHVPHRRPDGHLPGQPAARLLHPRHLLRRRALPLGRHGARARGHGRPVLLGTQDHRATCSTRRSARSSSGSSSSAPRSSRSRSTSSVSTACRDASRSTRTTRSGRRSTTGARSARCSSASRRSSSSSTSS